MKRRDEILLWQRYQNTRGDDEPSLLEVADELGMAYKRVRYLALKWGRKDLYDWGVSWRVGWLTPLGEVATITLYGFEFETPRDAFGKCGY